MKIAIIGKDLKLFKPNITTINWETMGSSSKDKKKDKRHKKEKKRRRRDSRSPSPSTDSSSDSGDDRRKHHRAEKLAKKVARHLEKHEHHHGTTYTDEDNPFGDPTLSKRFVWTKKIEKKIEQGVDVKELTAKAEQRRHQERIEEIEKVKRRREQRELEREEGVKEHERLARENAMQEAVQLEEKEEEFHLQQARLRSFQRIQAGRAKPMDPLVSLLWSSSSTSLPLDNNNNNDDDHPPLPPHLLPPSPHSIFQGLTLSALRETVGDINAMKEMDIYHPLHIEFWECLSIVAHAELMESIRQDAIDRAKMRESGSTGSTTYHQYAKEAGWHDTIEDDVVKMFSGKSHAQLSRLEHDITMQLQQGDGGGDNELEGAAFDPGYWSAVLRRLVIAKAGAKLREMYDDMMYSYKSTYVGTAATTAGTESQFEQHERELLKQGEEAGLDPELLALALNHKTEEEEEEEEGEEGGEMATTGGVKRGEPESWEETQQQQQKQQEEKEEEERRRLNHHHNDNNNDGQYSPRPLAPEHYGGMEVVDEEDDLREIQVLRAQIRYKAAQEFAASSGRGGGIQAGAVGSGEADRIYRQIVRDPEGANAVLGVDNSLFKYVTVESGGGGEGEAGPSSSSRGAAVEAPQQPIIEEEEERRMMTIASRMMGGDMNQALDAPFTGGEISSDNSNAAAQYWWHDKYRPRKPKYFNRVHTGFEWNSYNKTHYDSDNPPPKTIQGYKFNIFYPDLIDKTQAPKFKIERDDDGESGGGGDGSTCILRFTAGPPYEDVSFRILNKEWEYNHKRGFKCVFERGILHLFFNFKRPRYRR